MTSSAFPDVNVWLALTSPDHEHSQSAWNWYRRLPEGASLYFCRITQLGLLRLLTTRAVMGAGTLSQSEAWQAYDQWLTKGGARLCAEATDLETRFRRYSHASQSSPKVWADAYLAAYAESRGLTLVTFDRALAGKVAGALHLA